MADKIRKIDPNEPDHSIIQEGAEIIRNGGVVVFPTTGLYGLGADAHHTDAVERVFSAKQRPADNPILILVPDMKSLNDLVEEIPSPTEKIMDRFWPGSVTLVFLARPQVSTMLTAGTGKIGIRLPAHPAALRLVSTFGEPITGTSANRSGEPGIWDVNDLPVEITDAVDLVLDAGPLKGGPGSTVVDVTTDPPTILREGALATVRITELLSGLY